MFRLTLGHTLLGTEMPILSQILPTARPYSCPVHGFDAVVLGGDLGDLRPVSDQRWVLNASVAAVVDGLGGLSSEVGITSQGISPVAGLSPVTGKGGLGIDAGNGYEYDPRTVDFTAEFGANGSTSQSYERGVRYRTG